MPSGREKLVAAMRRSRQLATDEAQSVMQLGTVTSDDPFQIELHESNVTLHDDQIVFTQWVKRYHGVDEIDSGDTVVLLRKKTGGEIHYVVTDVLSDKTPS